MTRTCKLVIDDKDFSQGQRHCITAKNGLLTDIHCVQKKTPTYVFDYNSGVSWSIFILFVPVEREMNTLQFTYLQS